jgi:DNA-binding NarL/FixJ family response regulator
MHKLTPRQFQILKLACDGLSNKRIAIELGLLEGSVKQLMSLVMGTLQVTSRTQLLRAALVAGLYSLPGYTLQPIPWQELARGRSVQVTQ